MVEKIGRTILFVVFIVFLIVGAKMAIKVSIPTIRKASPSLADSLAGI